MENYLISKMKRLQDKGIQAKFSEFPLLSDSNHSRNTRFSQPEMKIPSAFERVSKSGGPARFIEGLVPWKPVSKLEESLGLKEVAFSACRARVPTEARRGEIVGVPSPLMR
jgi:hypothetical protein